MADTGWVFGSGGTQVAQSGTRAWGSPANIEADDGNRATKVYDAADANSGGDLAMQNFGFGIPSGSTIDGVQVETKSGTHGADTWYDGEAFGGANFGVYLINEAGNIEGSDKKNLAFYASNTVRGYGGSSDLWGVTWLASEVNDPDFGFSYTCGWTHKGAGSNTFRMNYVKMKIFYTPPPFKPSCVVF